MIDEKLLAKCDACGYIGTHGHWKGYIITRDKRIPFDGYVKKYHDGETWDLDTILLEVGDGNFDGMCYCPICDSADFD